MGKIDEYNEIKERNSLIKKVLNKMIGRGECLTSINKSPTEPYEMMTFSKHDYGRSSRLTLYGTCHNLGEYIGVDEFHGSDDYLIDAINLMMPEIVKMAIKIVESEVEKKRIDAQDEAKEVLKMVS